MAGYIYASGIETTRYILRPLILNRLAINQCSINSEGQFIIGFFNHEACTWWMVRNSHPRNDAWLKFHVATDRNNSVLLIYSINTLSIHCLASISITCYWLIVCMQITGNWALEIGEIPIRKSIVRFICHNWNKLMGFSDRESLYVISFRNCTIIWQGNQYLLDYTT